MLVVNSNTLIPRRIYPRRKWNLMFVVLVLALFGALLTPTACWSDASPQRFCKREEGRYVETLRRMPRVHLLPGSGRLPFAASSAHFSAITHPVVVGGGQIGYGFSSEDDEGGQSIGWTFRGRVVPVDGRGQAIRNAPIAERMTRSHGDLSDLQLRFNLSSQPALYKVELTFRNRAGHLLGKYGEYVRVVKRTVNVAMRLSDSVFSPEQTLYMRVANLGTVTVHSGPEFVLEHLLGGRWTTDPASPQDVWRTSLQVLFAGESSHCQEFEIPMSQPAGLYRLSKDGAGDAQVVAEARNREFYCRRIILRPARLEMSFRRKAGDASG
jgi:hypothetical protein